MSEQFINLTIENIDKEHLCCAIADKKHQAGVAVKKNWLKERIAEGHVFRKLDEKGKVFIEYAPLETAWVPVHGDNYLYIYCLWVAGSFKGKGYAKSLIEYCINDAKEKGKSGVCILSSKKKKPYLADKKFLLKYGFEVVDTVKNEYELLALSFNGEKPYFSESVKEMRISGQELTIYYGLQCPYIPNCIEQVQEYCTKNNIPLNLIAVDTLEKRKKCMLSTGSMTDPYIPLESKIGNVRKALALANKYGFGFTLITKSDRVLRDLDLLKSINDKTKCVVQMTLTTYDEDLCKKIEPNVSTTKERFEALKKLNEAGIPTIVWLCPILPFINDTEENIRGILEYCIEAKVYGVICFGMGLTLREGNREYFYSQLDRLFPHMKEKYIRTYGMQYQLSSPKHNELMKLFHQICEGSGIMHNNSKIFEYLYSFEEKNSPIQLNLFD